MDAPQLKLGAVATNDGNFAVTPNFWTKEFSDIGMTYVHYDDVQILQHLRDELGGPIRVLSHYPHVYKVSVEPTQRQRFLGIAGGAVSDSLLFSADQASGDLDSFELHINVFRTISKKLAMRKALEVNSKFETGRSSGYDQVTGNFDGTGFSFGILQWNVETGSLLELFKMFAACDRKLLVRCFGGEAELDAFMYFLGLPWPEQKKRLPNYLSGKDVNAYYTRVMQRIGSEQVFKDVQAASGAAKYFSIADKDLSQLEGITGRAITSAISYAALFDCAVQQGGLGKALPEIRDALETGRYTTERAVVDIAVTLRAQAAKKRWVADCHSRRLGILLRKSTYVSTMRYQAKRHGDFHKLFNREIIF